jgi:hypothetical protein
VLKPKDLIGIPWMVAFALRADGWWLRSDIIWAKPNPMPESVTDRPTKSHEYIFLLTKSAKYFYDSEAIKEPSVCPNDLRAPKGSEGAWQMDGRPADNNKGRIREGNATRNKRDVWTVTTKPYREAHFATFPPDLIEPCILAGTSEKGECPKCGKAWKRVVDKKKIPRNELPEDDPRYRPNRYQDNKYANELREGFECGMYSESTTIGWMAQCQCVQVPVPQTVLDPFSGSGTTGAVAIKHGRNYIGCELNPSYIEMTNRRLAKVQPLLL